MLSEKIDFSSTTEELTNPTILNRPSSPRKFFERLYGHLETENKSSEVQVSESTRSSSISLSSGGSPHNVEDIKKLDYFSEHKFDTNNFEVQQISQFPFGTNSYAGFRPFGADAHLPAGLSAFCKYSGIGMKPLNQFII